MSRLKLVFRLRLMTSILFLFSFWKKPHRLLEVSTASSSVSNTILSAVSLVPRGSVMSSFISSKLTHAEAHFPSCGPIPRSFRYFL